MVVDGIERFNAGIPFCRVFARNYRDRVFVYAVSEALEVFVFDNACIWNVGGCVVDNGAALDVRVIYCFGFKAYASVFEHSETVVEKFVYFSGEYYFVCQRRQVFPVLEEIGVKLYVGTFEKFFDKFVVTSYWNSLISVGKIVVVECEPYGKAAYDECRQVGAFPAPLFFGVTFYKEFVDIAPY